MIDGYVTENHYDKYDLTITDQITDQYAPYCSELKYALFNKHWVVTDNWWMR